MQEEQRLTARFKVKLQRATKTSESRDFSISKTLSLLRLRSEYSKENCTYLQDEV